ncbi:MAG TPA: hypothetical protein VMW52_08915 [Phycisphaerae bacterium]|nr:hypothetical protein [Phycisphaerae bacterium]
MAKSKDAKEAKEQGIETAPPSADPPIPAAPDDAAAEQQRRLAMAELNAKLATKRCPACTTVGMWRVNRLEETRGRIRYVACKACGHSDRVAVTDPASAATARVEPSSK